jgi:hypothetical protein
MGWVRLLLQPKVLQVRSVSDCDSSSVDFVLIQLSGAFWSGCDYTLPLITC